MRDIEIKLSAQQKIQIVWWMVFCISIAVKYTLFYAMTNQIYEVAFGSLVWSVWFALFFCTHKSRKARLLYVACDAFVTLLLVADVQYFQYFGDFVRVFQFGQMDEFKRVLPQLSAADLIPQKQAFLLFIFVFVESFALFHIQNQTQIKPAARCLKALRVAFLILFILVVWNPLSVGYCNELHNSEALVCRVRRDIEWGVDALQTNIMDSESKRTQVSEQLEEYRNQKSTKSNPYYGIAKDRNVYVIQVESLSAFLFGSTYNGQEITPVLNALAQADSMTFANFYSAAGAGHTSDAEYAVLNGVYPVSEYGVFGQYEDNTFYALPDILRASGYTTSAYHGNEADYYNRDVVYPKLGILSYYNLDNMECTDVIGWGMSDKELFCNAATRITAQSGKQFVHLVTLTSHTSFVGADESIGGLDIAPEDAGTEFAGYICAIHYADAAIGTFIEQLKENGDYDNSVIVIYGDHAGMEVDADNKIEQLTGRTYGAVEKKAVACLIHMPDSGVAQEVYTAASQVDLFPTLLDLLGISYDDTYVAGVDILTQDDGFVMVDENSFIDADNYYFKSESAYRCYSLTTGKTQKKSPAHADIKAADLLYNASKYIIRNDYLKDK